MRALPAVVISADGALVGRARTSARRELRLGRQREAIGGGCVLFSAEITFWLWLGVANFPEAVAEGRGKA